MNRKYLLLYVLITLLLISCRSIPEAGNNNQTLIVGEISFEGRGYSEGFASLNGNHRSGIEITIQNTATNQTYTLRSRIGGRFFSVNVPPGTYRVTRLFFTSSAGTTSWWNNPPSGILTVNHGMVNNFGRVNWISTHAGGPASGRSNDRLSHEGHDQVRNDFLARNPRSNWNDRQWVSHGAPSIALPGNVIAPSVTLASTPQNIAPPVTVTAPIAHQTNVPAITSGIGRAINRASNILINNLPEDSRIAVISISSNNTDLSAYILDALEFYLVSARRFIIVDRSTLDAIRSEQNLHLSGEISDASAVSIGQMLGANIVITGNTIGIGTNQTLSVRALDVASAQILTMARETF